VPTSRIASLLLVALVLLCQPVASQTTDLGKFRVLLKTGERFELSSGTLSSDSLTGMTGNGFRSIPVQSIRALDRSMGTQAGKCALIGGAMGLTSALLGWMQAESDAASDPYTEVDDSKVGPLLLGFTAGGALIGLAIGSSMEEWKKVPVDGSFGYIPENKEIRFQLSLAF
jgi:hypothetical protein